MGRVRRQAVRWHGAKCAGGEIVQVQMIVGTGAAGRVHDEEGPAARMPRRVAVLHCISHESAGATRVHRQYPERTDPGCAVEPPPEDHSRPVGRPSGVMRLGTVAHGVGECHRLSATGRQRPQLPHQVEHDPASIGRKIEREIGPFVDLDGDFPLVCGVRLAPPQQAH